MTNAERARRAAGRIMRDAAALERIAAAAVATGDADPLELAAYRTALADADRRHAGAVLAAERSRADDYADAMAAHYGATPRDARERANGGGELNGYGWSFTAWLGAAGAGRILPPGFAIRSAGELRERWSRGDCPRDYRLGRDVELAEFARRERD
jgi:hypothetical protein